MSSVTEDESIGSWEVRRIEAAMKMFITVAGLLAIFEGAADEQLVYPPTARVQAMVEQAPADASEYVRLGDEAFSTLVLVADERDEVEFERFLSVLRLLLYVDGRSERGLLRVAELAYTNETKAEMGINALAALANHYRSSAPDVDIEDLVAKLKRYETNALLAHNARTCLRLIARHAPD